MRFDVLKQSRIYIPPESRVCPDHQINVQWSDAARFTEFSKKQIEDMIDLLRGCQCPQNSVEGVQPRPNIKCDTGLNEEQFEIVFSIIKASLVQKFKHKVAVANTSLYMYLMRLRKGLTFENIGNHFGLSRVTVSKSIDVVRKVLVSDFVPLHLGFQNLTRDHLIDNTTQAARILYTDGDSDKLITVWDATYIFCEKSGNYDFQKSTYNSQKKRNFVKPMMCVTTNGTIVDAIGPFEATVNDATIIKKIFEKDDGTIMSVIRPRDVFLVDRGFRDCVEYLRAKEIDVFMPCCVDKKTPNQPLSTEQANQSRRVTKGRFVVEARNGHLKTIWAIFSKTWSTGSLPYLMNDIHIGSALINRFTSKIVADKEDEEAIANGIMSKQNEPNTFASKIISDAFQKHVKEFVEIDSANFEFPELSLLDLKNIAKGSYQLKQSRSYIVRHINNNNERKFISYMLPSDSDTIGLFFGTIIDEKNVSKPLITLTLLQSRHFNNKFRRVFILADAVNNSMSGIVGYYCDCMTGRRTAGCCSHIMTVLKYFGYTRRNENEKPIREYLDDYFYSSEDEIENEVASMI